MATSSILGGNAAPQRPRGTGTDLMGPSDSSDSGSDVQGERSLATDTDDGGAGALPVELDSDTDSTGTGERGAATGADPRDGDDILPNRIIRTSDALDDADRLEVDELVADDDLHDEEIDGVDESDEGPDGPARH
jgi:hypothetical protein